MVAIFAATSCKKEYTCECKTTDSTGAQIGSPVTTTAEFKKEADAESWCSAETNVGGISTKCALK